MDISTKPSSYSWKLDHHFKWPWRSIEQKACTDCAQTCQATWAGKLYGDWWKILSGLSVQPWAVPFTENVLQGKDSRALLLQLDVFYFPSSFSSSSSSSSSFIGLYVQTAELIIFPSQKALTISRSEVPFLFCTFVFPCFLISLPHLWFSHPLHTHVVFGICSGECIFPCKIDGVLLACVFNFMAELVL